MAASPAATQTEYLTKKDACEQLGLKDRRLRDYVTAGKIRQENGLLHAGDVARLQEERSGRKAGSKIRALSNVAAELSAEQRALLAKVGAAVVPMQPGKAALQLASAAANGQPAERPFDEMPACVRLTVKEAAAYLRMPAPFILDLVKSGALPAVELSGHRWRIKRSDLERLP